MSYPNSNYKAIKLINDGTIYSIIGLNEARYRAFKRMDGAKFGKIPGNRNYPISVKFKKSAVKLDDLIEVIANNPPMQKPKKKSASELADIRAMANEKRKATLANRTETQFRRHQREKRREGVFTKSYVVSALKGIGFTRLSGEGVDKIWRCGGNSTRDILEAASEIYKSRRDQSIKMGGNGSITFSEDIAKLATRKAGLILGDWNKAPTRKRAPKKKAKAKTRSKKTKEYTDIEDFYF